MHRPPPLPLPPPPNKEKKATTTPKKKKTEKTETSPPSSPEIAPTELAESPTPQAKKVSNVAMTTVSNLVEKAYLDDVRDTIKGRFFWRKVADYAEVTARTLSGVAAMLAFASGTFSMQTLSFAAGSVSTVAMILGLWVSYANKESRERSRELNAVLQALGIGALPDLAAYQVTSNALNVYNKESV